LGDYTDRGPRSRDVLDWLVERDRTGRLVALRGNHDLIMLAARSDETMLGFWLANGGRDTLRSYAPPGQDGALENVPEEHWQFLAERTRPYFQTDTHLFVHASLQSELPPEQQSEHALYWKKIDGPDGPPAPHCSGKPIVCGHTSQGSGRPLSFPGGVCIDTRVYRDGWLTCLDVATGHYWQANQRGEAREDRLADWPPTSGRQAT
jgi:serine/threonine protein phosphatase 1